MGDKMSQAIINFGEFQERILTIVKGKYGFKNKDDAANYVVQKFGENLLEPELRPEYKKELMKIDEGKFKRVKSINSLRKELEDV